MQMLRKCKKGEALKSHSSFIFLKKLFFRQQGYNLCLNVMATNTLHFFIFLSFLLCTYFIHFFLPSFSIVWIICYHQKELRMDGLREKKYSGDHRTIELLIRWDAKWNIFSIRIHLNVALYIQCLLCWQ